MRTLNLSLKAQAPPSPRANSLHSSIGLGSDGDDEDSGGDVSDDEDGQSGKGVAEEEDEEEEVLVPQKRKGALQRATKSHPFIISYSYFICVIDRFFR